MKKVWSWLCVAAMLFCMVPAMAVSAADDEIPVYQAGDYLVIFVTEETLEIVGYTGSASSLTIPQALAGYTVVSIGSEAFNGCTTLKSVTVQSNVKSVGSGAFGGCTRLTTVSLPSSLTLIEAYVFSGCSALTTVNIPSGVKKIEYNAFYGCSSLKSVTIPSNVTCIEVSAFEGCRAMTSVTIPNSVTSLESRAFKNCTSLKTITMSSNLKYLGAEAFANTGYSTTASNWKKGVLYVSHNVAAVNASQIGSICALRPGTKVIADEAFASCSALKKVTLPSSLKNIGSNAFNDCDSLQSVTIPGSVKNVGSNVFGGCDALTQVTFGNGVATVEDYAFMHCPNIRKVTIPSSMQSIGEYAFCKTEYDSEYGWTNTVPLTIPYVYYGGTQSQWGNGRVAATRLVCDCLIWGDMRFTMKNNQATIVGYYHDGGALEFPAVLDGVRVTAIASDVFAENDGLTDVYFGAKKSEWRNLSVGSNNPLLSNVTMHYINYTDVERVSFYYDSVLHVSKEGFITGYSDGTFRPSKNMTRQDFVVVLARIAGADLKPYANSTGGFKDVKKGSYYAPAVAWAVDNGIVTGYNSRTFGVGDPLTREQVATILYRYQGSPKVYGVSTTLSQFTDKAKISDYAKDAVVWAVQYEIITGRGVKFDPKGKASRAQTATIVARMDNQCLFD